MGEDKASLYDLRILDAEAESEFDSLTEIVGDVTKADVALISIVDVENDRQFFKSARGLSEPWASLRQTPLSHSFCKHVCATGRPLVVEDAREDVLVKDNGAVADLGVIAYIGVPIHGPDGAPIGALCAIEGEPRVWTESDLGKLKKIAAFVDDKIRLRAELLLSEQRLDLLCREMEAREAAEAQLRLLASTDPLTGALNRRAFFQGARSVTARLNISRTDAAVIAVDLDWFKRINDTYGHQAGDDVLVAAFNALSEVVRSHTDLLARFGGEEFILLSPSADIEGALRTAERCRAAIEQLRIPLTVGDVAISITASFGVAQLAAEAWNLDAALLRADAALYRAKESGRNRVVHASLDDGARNAG